MDSHSQVHCDIFLIGPFPLPIHGMSLANDILLRFYKDKEGLSVGYHDTTIEREIKNKKEQGRLRIRPLIKGIANTVTALVNVFKHRGACFYITPPQSVLGYLRSWPIILLASYCGQRTVIHFHGSRFAEHFQQAPSWVRRLINSSLQQVSNVILLGDSIAQSHQSVIPANKIVVCHNGVPIPDIADKLTEHSVFKVLYLSNLMKDKGIFDFIDAVEMLEGKQLEIHIAGAIEQQYQVDIESRLASLANRVTYHGVVRGNEKHQLFVDADIFVLPSYDEGQPLSILEAYAYGCAVVTTSVGGIPDIFQSGKNGEFCQVNDPGSINLALIKIIENGVNKYSDINRKIACADFSEAAFFQRIDQVIRGKC